MLCVHILVVLIGMSRTGCLEFAWRPVDSIFTPYFCAAEINCLLGDNVRVIHG